MEGSGVLADPSRILGCEFRRYKIILKISIYSKEDNEDISRLTFHDCVCVRLKRMRTHQEFVFFS